MLIDAFVGARVPRHLVTLEALADLARVVAPGGWVAINVVDARPLDEAAAVLAGLQAAFAHVTALAPSATLARRRGGNIVLAGSHVPLPFARLRPPAAADRSPAALLEPGDVDAFVGGAMPWRDGAAAAV